jgi:hypothetical protein
MLGEPGLKLNQCRVAVAFEFHPLQTNPER